MFAKIRKWGNSQGLRLSKDLLELADFVVGDELEVVVKNHEILLKKTEKPRYNIADLVAEIPPDYRPTEVDLGRPVGREEW